MKKNYEFPIMTVAGFDRENVVTSSGGGNNGIQAQNAITDKSGAYGLDSGQVTSVNGALEFK